MKQFIKTFIWLLIFSSLSLAQQSKPPLADTPSKNQIANEKSMSADRPPEITSVVDAALTAPPEFGSDVLIRLAQSNRIKDSRWKRELLEEAFNLAAKSEQKTKQTYFGTVADTREGYLGLALAENIDALSLQVKVVAAMLDIDKTRARELFLQIPEPDRPTLTCDAALVPDVTQFYLVLKRIVNEAFTANETANGGALWFLQKYVQGIRSPVQVGPLAQTIAGLNLPAAQMTVLIQSFSDSLKRVSGDFRTFISATSRDRVAQSFGNLSQVCDKLGIPKQYLAQSLRAFIVSNFAAVQCTDERVQPTKGVPGFVAVINRDLLRAAPISTEDILGSGVGPDTQTHPFWESSKSKNILNKLRKLRFGADGQPRTDAEKATDDWHQSLTQFLNELDEWTASDEPSEVDYFHEKAIMYRVLSDIIPNGLMRDNIWRENATFLANGYLPNNRIEWFMHAKHFLDRINSLKGNERGEFIGILKASSNPVLRAYAYLSELS